MVEEYLLELEIGTYNIASGWETMIQVTLKQLWRQSKGDHLILYIVHFR